MGINGRKLARAASAPLSVMATSSGPTGIRQQWAAPETCALPAAAPTGAGRFAGGQGRADISRERRRNNLGFDDNSRAPAAAAAAAGVANRKHARRRCLRSPRRPVSAECVFSAAPALPKDMLEEFPASTDINRPMSGLGMRSAGCLAEMSYTSRDIFSDSTGVLSKSTVPRAATKR